MNATLALLAAPALATALLLAAAHRVWLCRRAWVEAVAFIAFLGTAVACLLPFPAIVSRALAPFAVLVAAWLAAALATWRFAPDSGQSGLGWTALVALPAAVSVGLILAPLQLALGVVALPPPVHFAVLAAAPLLARISTTFAPPSSLS